MAPTKQKSGMAADIDAAIRAEIRKNQIHRRDLNYQTAMKSAGKFKQDKKENK